LIVAAATELTSSSAFASACCGGGFAIPSIIAGDDQAQMTASYSNASADTDVYASGIWQKRSLPQTVQTIRLDSAYVFADRFQTGVSLPFIQQSQSANSSGYGLGDILSDVAYEILPDWDYNLWRPKEILFLTLTLPTGQGRSFWALGFGTVLTKTIRKWDANISIEAHKSFSKSVSENQIQGKANPGFGGSLTPGLGYNWMNFRLGGSISWLYEDPIKTEGQISSEGSLQRVATAAVSASVMLDKDWATSLTYSDQSLFGEPLNTSLNKTVLLSLQKRWER
jgi:hypothetical protein